MSRVDTTSPKPTCLRIGKPRHFLYTEVEIKYNISNSLLFLTIKLNFLDGH